jgi:hypothetical protein
MATEQDLSSEIAAAIAGVSHQAHYTDADGKGTLKQEDAIYQYLPEQSVMVMVNHDNNNVEIWFDPIKTDKEWFEETFKPTIEEIAHRNLYGITIRSYAGDITPKKMIHRTDVAESRNTTKTSYKPLGGTKLILRHSKPVTEEKPGARSRNIGAIFVEKDGERFRYPYNHLLGARVMALHIESGGKPWDENGSKILEISRRRKDIMELLRWSKRLDNTQQIDEIRERGQDEVVALKRTMERAARTGDLSGVFEYQLPPKDSVTEQSMVSEAISEFTSKLDKFLLG